MSAGGTKPERPVSVAAAHGFPRAPASWHRAVAGRVGCVRARARGSGARHRDNRPCRTTTACRQGDKSISPTDLLLNEGMDRLLQRAHHFEISRFDREGIPVGLWLALEHFFQGVTKLGDRGPRIGRPGREPLPQQTVPIDVEVPTLIQAPPPPGVSCHPEDRAITVPGARRVATLLSPGHPPSGPTTPGVDHSPRNLRPGSRRRIVRPPAETVRSPGDSPRPTPATSDPPETRRPPTREDRDRSELFVRSPEKCEGILIVGDAESAERRDIERVADVREPVQARQPPDGKSRGGDRKADRQDDRDPQQLAEPLAQQLKQSSTTYHSPPRVRDSRIGSA